MVSSVGEGMRLWSHVLFGTNTCVSMIEGYQQLGMPGDPLPAIIQLRDRLSNLIHTIEGQRNATRFTKESPSDRPPVRVDA